MSKVDARALLAQREAREPTREAHADSLTYDLGRLAAFDRAAVNTEEFRRDSNSYVSSCAKTNVELLLKHIFHTPREEGADGSFAILPAAVYPLPRAQPLPKPRPPTRWEKFAAEKGIQKRKKDTWVYDQKEKEWKTQYGYKRATTESDDWVKEHNPNDDPSEDPFAKAKRQKKERVDKQHQREERNILERENPEAARQLFSHAPKKLTYEEKQQKRAVAASALSVAQVSTGSLGKFDERLKGEKTPKPLKKAKKESAVVDLGGEKSRSLKVLSKLMDDGASLDSTKAGNRYVAFEQKMENNNKRGRGGKGGRRFGGKRNRKSK